MDADVLGEYPKALQRSLLATRLFHSLANPAGEDRAQVEQSYALLRNNDIPGCYRAAHLMLGRNPRFAWIQIHALTQDAVCDPAPGTAAENNPVFQQAISLARDSRYTLLELRAWNLLGAAAVDSGDSEAAWRIYLPVIRRFYSGDYPAIRLYSTLSGLEEVEQATPRVHNALLLQREVVGVLELTDSRELIPTERLNLVDAAIRAGSIPEAQQQMQLAQNELATIGGGKSVQGFLAETETDLANLYLDRHDLTSAARLLDSAHNHMAGENNSYHRRDYAVARGELELAQGHRREALCGEHRPCPAGSRTLCRSGRRVVGGGPSPRGNPGSLGAVSPPHSRQFTAALPRQAPRLSRAQSFHGAGPTRQWPGARADCLV
jgi:hypothetical protein